MARGLFGVLGLGLELALLTRAMRPENGRPPSRAKAHSIREAVKRRPTKENNWVIIIMQI